jgi:hypothetical protein
MISALERLRALRATKYGEVVGINHPADLPTEWRIDWEERAAILQYDGGKSRDEAERDALREITDRLQRRGDASAFGQPSGESNRSPLES